LPPTCLQEEKENERGRRGEGGGAGEEEVPILTQCARSNERRKGLKESRDSVDMAL